MAKLQFRIRPLLSLADLNMARMRKALGDLPGVADMQTHYDVATDANFVTIVLTLADESPEVLAGLAKALLGLPNVIPFIVDEHGYQTAVESLDPQEFMRYARES